MKTSTSLLTAHCSIWIACLNALLAVATLSTPAWAAKPIVIETDSDARFSVEQTHQKNQWSKNLVIEINHRIYRVPDDRVSGWDDGKETDRPHNFYLSPDQKWLFVTKHLWHPVDVGYLYHLSGSCFIRVRPGGQRFDTAALEFFATHIHTPLATIGAGARSIRFEKWTADGKGLIFWLAISKNYDRRPSYLVSGYYGLKSHRFQVISHEGPE